MPRPIHGSHNVAVGPGPRWFRRGLVGLACLYYAALIHHPPNAAWLGPILPVF
ncbi:MAG TPA: hypothetical protein VHN14_22365 [Kofleriaceae bacterium]|nr:hypothetical protein [Kofleriaceae bacterium]